MEQVAIEKSLRQLLAEKREGLVKKWYETVVETYPDDVKTFMRNTSAQFTNPMGYNFAHGIEGLFDGLVKGLLPDAVADFLDGIVRLRAIQDFAPSEAVAFIFRLKGIVRDELRNDPRGGALAAELAEFDSAVDDLALYAFDLYMKCREKLYDIKAREAQKATFRLLQKARIITGEDV